MKKLTVICALVAIVCSLVPSLAMTRKEIEIMKAQYFIAALHIFDDIGYYFERLQECGMHQNSYEAQEYMTLFDASERGALRLSYMNGIDNAIKVPWILSPPKSISVEAFNNLQDSKRALIKLFGIRAGH